MSDTKRTLKINPQLFMMNGKKGGKKPRTLKVKPKPIPDEENSSKLKHVQKAMLNRVKNYQKQKEVEARKDEVQSNNPQVGELFEKNQYEDVNFDREFDKSFNFMRDLSLKNKDKRRRRNQTIKNKPVVLEINLELPSNLEKNAMIAPSGYSSLKNGSRPTYRELNKTQKNPNAYKPSVKISLENNKYDRTDENEPSIIPQVKPQVDIVIPPAPPPPPPQIEILTDPADDELKINKPIKSLGFAPIVAADTIEILNTAEPAAAVMEIPKQEEPIVDVVAPPPVKRIPKINKVTRTSTYKLGKHKNRRQVGILIKNNQTQKNVKREITGLKQKSIQEIKNYLRCKNLIKAGSEAPNDVLRKLYEDCLLSGEVNNINSNNLLYNYLNN